MPFMFLRRIKIKQTIGNNHIIIIHTVCGHRSKDYYLADIVYTLICMSRMVTICTTHVEEHSPLSNIKDSRNMLHFLISSPCYPFSIISSSNICYNNIKILWLVFQIILKPPKPTPSLIITDSNALVVSLLKKFRSYPVIYINHFSMIQRGSTFYPLMSVFLQSSVARALTQADEVVVPTSCLKEVFERSLPNFKNKVTVLNPCYDIGDWLNTSVNINKIVPALRKNYILFVTFTEFKRRSNLALLIRAFEHYTYHVEKSIAFRTHLVIAGFSDPLNDSEMRNYNALRKEIWRRPYRLKVTFFNQTSIIQQKTLIDNCTAIINPTNYNVYPGAVLMAMNFKKSIISVNNGFAAEVLENDVSGILVEDKPYIFATKMYLLVKHPEVGKNIGESAKARFDENYSCFMYSYKVNSMITRQINRHS